MLVNIDPKALSSEQKAKIILTQAQIESQRNLWHAALAQANGDEDSAGDGNSSAVSRLLGHSGASPMNGLDALIQALGMDGGGQNVPRAPVQAGTNGKMCGIGDAGGVVAAYSTTPVGVGDNMNITAIAGGGLGPNEAHRGALVSAGKRTGMPPAALAAIIDAEAAKSKGGAWNVYSRNSRSSAAGLGQFLSGTWVGMAQTRGTWLNDRAREQGWLDSKGQVRSDMRGAVLSLRYDPVASIETIADYSRANIARIRNSGVEVGNDVTSVAQAAYIGHHLGPGDAQRFYTGTISSERAARLLAAQIGSDSASKRIAQMGDARAAHRNWLTSYIAKSVQPERYTNALPA